MRQVRLWLDLGHRSWYLIPAHGTSTLDPILPSSAYQNGAWIEAEELRVGVDDLGFTMGVTVVERLRTFGGVVFRLDEHLSRLSHSLEIVGLNAQDICSEIGPAIGECVRKNFAQLDSDDDLGVVAFATPGSPARSEPHVCVYTDPLPFESWARQYEDGIELSVSGVRQVPTNCWPAELKCRSRMHYYLADLSARSGSPATRAVLLDQDGFVGEATTANILIYRPEEGLITPPRERVLPGVTLAVIEELAAKLGIPFREGLFRPDELLRADEVLLVSTSVCVLPVVRCDDQQLGAGTPGPIYRQLLAAWRDLVGVDVALQAEARSRHRLG